MRRSPILGILAVLVCGASGSHLEARDLSFAERIDAQRAIQRVYYSHRIGTSRPFEEAVPDSLLAGKVQAYLEQSAALERVWNVVITAEMLDVEIERLSARTRMPDRLEALFEALDYDRLLIRECLARPLLAGRLSRNFFAFDKTIHAGSRRDAEQLRVRVMNGLIDPDADRQDRTELELTSDAFPHDPALGVPGPLHESRDSFYFDVPLVQTSGTVRVARFEVTKRQWKEWWNGQRHGIDARDVKIAAVETGAVRLPPPMLQTAGTCEGWDNGSLGGFPEDRFHHTVVWTGSEMIVWGGLSGTYLDSGGRYDPVTDTWVPTSRMGAPSPRYGHTAVWSGSEMIVWGGLGIDPATGFDDKLGDGAKYDPASDTWAPVSMVSAPSKRAFHVGFWTGSRMVVLGGFSGPDAGGRYDPIADSWLPVSSGGGLEKIGKDAAAVWTGSEVLSWSGATGDGGVLISGSRYDPVADTWAAISTLNSPGVRLYSSAAWTGSRMIVWGGSNGGTVWLDSGALYDPSTDTWSPISTVDAPPARNFQRAVWTGQRMLVWGGTLITSGDTGAGGSYDPATDSWAMMTTANAPAERRYFSAVWTGSRMVVWGGQWISNLSTGGRYDPASDTWTPTAATTAPTGRTKHSAVWTGSEMIVWGGDVGNSPMTGGRYDPVVDDWLPVSTVDAPRSRVGHSAVWTGTEMLIWGGAVSEVSYAIVGGRYDPLTDTWSTMTLTGVPSSRENHSTVWTGSEMIVWGGSMEDIIEGTFERFDTGARYDPYADSWSPIATVGAPSPREDHTAIWTGDRMIVWGGSPPAAGATGAIYDPTADSWTPVTTIAAPDSRTLHTAVWTGSRMLIWGGAGNPSRMQTGGLYDPITDAWQPTSLAGAPAARIDHSAVWTGSEMIVWGGIGAENRYDSGGRYDPDTDHWTATSTIGAPAGRRDHTAVWTGSRMIVWGGDSLDSGGIYWIDDSPDQDDDGYQVCAGDCDDDDPAINPGAAEVCDGVDNNCNLIIDDVTTSPGLVSDLAAAQAGSSIDLQWVAAPLADHYDVVRGSARILGLTGDLATAFYFCVADDSPLLNASDAPVPLLGDALMYLVRGGHCAAPGSYDSGGAAQQGSRDVLLAVLCP